MQGGKRCVIGIALAMPIFTVACRDTNRDRSNATFTSRDSARTLGPGDVQIVNADSTIELALYGDSIVTGFGSKVMNEIRGKTDTSAVTGNGFAAGIEKMVKRSVASALDHEIKYAVADIQDVRLENGKLVFIWKDGSQMRLFENTNINKKPVSETFDVNDAQRFVAAFKARKTGSGA